ncbi:hypothetical protein EAH86_14090 [Pedococcus bigeumensis]|uniref:Uncharacterized protein n=1 Tax=Pedococcus bigeumensis TaxID=433644 RepID=A0A502CTU5_9MICO|nr:hypothetical protein EAH86_14090 [Pedococcus bigeumensis]
MTDRSLQSLVLHLLRSVGGPSWAPARAADRLLEQVDDALALRRARALLHVVSRNRIDPSHARAFATITMALNRLEHPRSPASPSTQAHGSIEVRP